MTGPYDDEPPWGRLPGDRADDDVLQLGSDRPRRDLRPSWWPSWRPPRIPRFAAILAVVALVVGVGAGFGAGYTAGRHHAAAAAPAAAASGATPSAAAMAGGPTLAQSGNVCSAQHGKQLQLGIQVVNDSTTALTLYQIRPVLPMGGLRVTSINWGACGQLPIDPLADGDPQAAAIDQYLPAQAAGWFTITVQVLVSCPSALPVQFQVAYGQHGKISTVPMAGFNDLANVGYPGCPSS
ncbi:MAG TPA: hypothetical protein VN847_19290 [Streptosporangiaceae bacterium]|nr:hypothetical protein [Streptosporangiaceae bacterium]